jgi:hypothetical protein
LCALLLLVIAIRPSVANAQDRAKPTAAKQSGLALQLESLDKQQKSLRQQLGISVEKKSEGIEFLFPPMLQPLQTDCPALEKDQVESLIASAAKKQSLKPELLRAVMKQESGFKPCAVSYKGAQGLMQLMPATATQLHVADPFDPEQNVQAGAAFLKQLMNRYNGDLRLALVAYNAGANRADQQAAPYPTETQDYLASIFAELGLNQNGVAEGTGSAATEPNN